MSATSALTLPPGVKGRVKGEVVVAIGNFEWAGLGKRPRGVNVLLRWWGQTAPGNTLQLMVHPEASEASSFSILVGHRHFTRYLRDMGTLSMVRGRQHGA